MAGKGKKIVEASGGLLSEADTSAARYMKEVQQYLKEVQRMSSGRNNSASLQIHEGTCQYLSVKLTEAVDFSWQHFQNWTPHQNPKIQHVLKKLYQLSKDIHDFVSDCYKNDWIFVAVKLADPTEHLSLLVFELLLCTRLVASSNARGARHILFKLHSCRNNVHREIKERAVVDKHKLLSKLEAHIASTHLTNRKEEKDIAMHLVQRLQSKLCSCSINARREIKEQAVDKQKLLSKLEAHIASTHLTNRKEEKDIAMHLVQRLQSDAFQGPRLLDASTLQMWYVDHKSLKNREQIGKGASATVYKRNFLGEEFAEKIFFDMDNEMFKNEVSILARLSHPHILPLLCCVTSKTRCSLVVELMDTDLCHLMRDKMDMDRSLNVPFNLYEAVGIMLQIAEGMEYLHRNRIVHKDLKAGNILVKCGKNGRKSKDIRQSWFSLLKGKESIDEEHVHVKVADFGLSKIKELSSTTSEQPVAGTTPWMAPELYPERNSLCCDVGTTSSHDGKNHPFKADVYSFGMVCYEILTGRRPFYEIQKMSLLKEGVVKGERPKLPEGTPPVLILLIQKCWMSRPTDRPSFTEICVTLRHLHCSLMQGFRMSYWEMIGLPDDAMKVIMNVEAMANNVCFNKNQCKRLAKRFGQIGEAVEVLDSPVKLFSDSSDDSHSSELGSQILALLKKGEFLVASYRDAGIAAPYVHGQPDNSEAFREIHDEIDSLQTYLYLETPETSKIMVGRAEVDVEETERDMSDKCKATYSNADHALPYYLCEYDWNKKQPTRDVTNLVKFRPPTNRPPLSEICELLANLPPE